VLSARLRIGWPLIPALLMLAYAGIVLVTFAGDMYGKDWPQRAADVFLLDRQVATAVDPSGTMTLDDMLRSGQFASSEAVHGANQGVAQTPRTAFWLKIGIPRLDESVRNWVLSLDLARAREAELYVPEGDGFRAVNWRRGDPGQLYRHPLFVLGPDDLDKGPVYMRTDTHSSMRALVRLLPLNHFLTAYESEGMAFGGLTGVLVGLAVYVGAMALALHDRIFASLAAMIVAFTCYLIADRGLLEVNILPGFNTLSRVLSLSATILIYAALLAFVRRWLDVAQWSRRLAAALDIAGVACIALAVEAAREALADEQIVRRFSSEVGLAVLLACLVVAIAALRHRRTRTVLFLACWLPAIATGAIRLGLDAWPDLGANPLLTNAVYFGSTFSLLCFSILASYSLQARERRLRRTAELMETRFRNFADSAADSFWETTATGEISYLEGPQIAELGLAGGRHITEGLARAGGEESEGLRRIRAALADGAAFRDVPVPVAGDGGESRFVLVSGVAARDRQGRISGFAGTVVDATAQHERRERMARQDKMAALGQLSAYIVHEINNLLHPVINLTRRLQRRHEADAETHRMTEVILDSADRMGEIVASVRKSLTLNERDMTMRPLAAAVRRGLEAIRPILPDSIQMQVQLDDIFEPEVSTGEMLQVLGNLVANAVRAIAEQGTIHVTLTRDGRTGTPCLTVRDTGCGMTEEVRRRAFEAFFTTRAEHEGTGLGLSVVSGILKGWGARARIVSAPGTGTSIIVTFATEDAKP
jgi:signal transduction histidine kinase